MNAEYDPDYGLCIRDCEKCEYNWKDGCGLDYNGDPRATFKDAVVIFSIFVTILILFILMVSWGVLQCFQR